MQLISCIKVS